MHIALGERRRASRSYPSPRLRPAVNPGALDSWSFWLTRRLVLALIRSEATLDEFFEATVQ